MLKVDQIEKIRQAYYVEGKSMREIAREYGHSRHTVKQAVEEGKAKNYTLKVGRPARKLGPYKERIKTMLKANENLPPKQRYRWYHIYKAIKAEGYEGSASTLRSYIGQVRKALKKPALYLPLSFEPGQDAQVDWAEAEVVVAGEPVQANLFMMRLNYSRKFYLRAYPTQRQEAFFEGHNLAFRYFGGVPHRLSYDNLKTAVYRILSGRNREEQASFIALRSHYLFESHYCTPGQGHEKGGVEQGLGYARRRFLVGRPEFESFEALNAYLEQMCWENDQNQVPEGEKTIGQAWQEEQTYLRPLPTEDYPCYRRLSVSRNPYSQVVIETNRYSVPVDQGGWSLEARLYPFGVEIYEPGQTQPLARHSRHYGQRQDIFDPLHYLALLEQRPGAFDYAKPLRQWRASWPANYEILLKRLKETWPDGQGVREFITILKLHQSYAPELVAEAISQALHYGACHADGVKLCLQNLLQPSPSPSPISLEAHPHLQDLGQQAVDLAAYDQLRGGR